MAASSAARSTPDCPPERIVIWSAIDPAKLPQIGAIVFGRSSRSFAKFAFPQVKEDVMAKSGKKWSADVTAHDHPFDLEPGLFANGSAQQIAAALKKAAQDPARHSDDPYPRRRRCSTSTSIAPAPTSPPTSAPSSIRSSPCSSSPSAAKRLPALDRGRRPA